MDWVEPDFQLFSSLRFDSLLLQSSENTALSPGPTPFYMLSYHRDRMLQAAAHFKWTGAIKSISGPEGLQRLLGKLEEATNSHASTALRVRILLHYSGDITVETTETPKVPLENLFPTRIPPPSTAEMKASPLMGAALEPGLDDTPRVSPIAREPQQGQAWTIKVDPEKTKPSSFTSYKTTRRDIYTEARGRVGIKTMAEPQEVLIVSDTGNEVMEGSLTSIFFWRNGRWVTPPVSSGGQVGTSRRWLLEKGLCEEEVVSSDSLAEGEECWISNGVRGLNWGKIKLYSSAMALDSLANLYLEKVC